MCGVGRGVGAMLGGMAGNQESEWPERSFGWSNMFVAPEDDPRPRGEVGGERATLLDYLAAYRLTLQMKCADLDAEAMARQSVPPSDLSLLGLVRHMADVERYWFREVMAGEDSSRYYPREPGRGAFDGVVADPDVVRQAWENWRTEIAFAEKFVADAPDLDVRGHYDQGPEDRGTIELREILLHMIEEYARHCGHADFLRERIDGRVGQ